VSYKKNEMTQQYGISSIESKLSVNESHAEEIRVRGFTVIRDVIEEGKLHIIRTQLDLRYQEQEDEFGEENMRLINELDMLRTPLLYDDIFLDLIRNQQVLNIVKSILGQEILLHLQNGIINRPNKEHHQSSWHRDLPYQEYTISKPLGISVFYCIDRFTSETGATILLPYSHKEIKISSLDFVKSNQVQISANAGDVLIFDSMVYHKAGYNSSKNIRRGINNVFVAPLLKQQINLPKMLNGKFSDNETLSGLLGYKYDVAESVLDYRTKRLERIRTQNE
jgi:ectoine hydroxylase-related dioxygenase (phytanoyl-CoA dioxygenase family)